PEQRQRPAAKQGAGECDALSRGRRVSGLQCLRLRMRSSFCLKFLHLDGGPKSLVTGEAMNIAPMLASRFNVDNGRYGHPIRLLGIMKMHCGVVNFTAHVVKTDIAQTGIHGRDQFSDRAALLLDPNRTGKGDWIVLATKLQRRGRRSTGNGLEVYFSKAHTI